MILSEKIFLILIQYIFGSYAANQETPTSDLDIAYLTTKKTEVIENGKLVYTSDTYKTDYFEMTTYSMYADLNEMNSNILFFFMKKENI